MSNQIKLLGTEAVTASASSALAVPHGRAWAIEPFSDPLQLERRNRAPHTSYSESDFQVRVPGN
jgi:hypothetical protein